MAILLLADHDNHQLSDQTAKALTAALEVGSAVHVLVAGASVQPIAEQAAKLSGVAKVLVADDPSLAHHLAEPLGALVAALAGPYDTLMAAATSVGKNVMPRAAALLDVSQVSEIIEVLDEKTFKRPIYAGNVIETVQTNEAQRVITVRTTAFLATGEGGSAAIEAVEVPADPELSSFVGAVPSTTSGRPELTSAKVIVSGGRAFGSEEKFNALLLPLADKLGAAVGASRAAVDAGYAPNDWQVGQTGKIVAPDLYIACGISGAIQHLAGMKESRVIVAINSDADAPIFQIADYGLVGDLFEVLPELEKAL